MELQNKEEKYEVWKCVTYYFFLGGGILMLNYTANNVKQFLKSQSTSQNCLIWCIEPDD